MEIWYVFLQKLFCGWSFLWIYLKSLCQQNKLSFMQMYRCIIKSKVRSFVLLQKLFCTTFISKDPWMHKSEWMKRITCNGKLFPKKRHQWRASINRFPFSSGEFKEQGIQECRIFKTVFFFTPSNSKVQSQWSHTVFSHSTEFGSWCFKVLNPDGRFFSASSVQDQE